MQNFHRIQGADSAIYPGIVPGKAAAVAFTMSGKGFQSGTRHCPVPEPAYPGSIPDLLKGCMIDVAETDGLIAAAAGLHAAVCPDSQMIP